MSFYKLNTPVKLAPIQETELAPLDFHSSHCLVLKGHH